MQGLNGNNCGKSVGKAGKFRILAYAQIRPLSDPTSSPVYADRHAEADTIAGMAEH